MLKYGDIFVPYAAMWDSEDHYFVAKDPAFGRLAICQHESPEVGVPKFAHPNVMRQRRCLKHGLCDLCFKTLKTSTKISLSNIGNIRYPNNYRLQQSEPLLHQDCAVKSIRGCPNLRKQIAAGKLQVKQVFAYDVDCTFATLQERADFVPEYDGPEILGRAILVLSKWTDITGPFLGRHFDG